MKNEEQFLEIGKILYRASSACTALETMKPTVRLTVEKVKITNITIDTCNGEKEISIKYRVVNVLEPTLIYYEYKRFMFETREEALQFLFKEFDINEK